MGLSFSEALSALQPPKAALVLLELLPSVAMSVAETEEALGGEITLASEEP
jgi:hypothetical protein